MKTYNHSHVIILGVNDNHVEMWEYLADDSDECIFCDRSLLKWKGRYQKNLRATSDLKKSRIREILQIEQLSEKLSKIQHATSITHHQRCLAKKEHKLFYESRVIKASKVGGINNWAIRNITHQKSFAEVKKFVIEKLVDDRQVHALRDIYQLYLTLFDEECTNHQPKSTHSKYSKHHSCAKLLEVVPGLTKTVFKNRTYLHRNDLTVSKLLSEGFKARDDFLSQIKSVAFGIRTTIMRQENRQMPKHNISIENIYEGECEIPIELYTLISSVIRGPRDCKSEKLETKVKSISSSIILSMTHGSVKPTTCLSLALVTKSITGSRRMVEILNRLGHCVSYAVVEEIESELAYGCAANSNILPYGLVPKNPELRTHVAFDNYDKFVETSSGKDTLHDTVGIVYQNSGPVNNANGQIIVQSTKTLGNIETERRRRTYFSDFDSNVESYTNKSQTMPHMVGKTMEIPQSLRLATDLNNMWMFYHAFGINGATRWFAWNAERIIDRIPIQKIGYLPNLNMSPTSDAVVLKTLRIALNIAEECEQKHIVVTYDLAIACKAYRIQADMAPELDRIFITLGAFHIELSFFKVFYYSSVLMFGDLFT